MGKTFRKEKTVSGQRKKLNKNRGHRHNLPFEEYEYDPDADDKINGRGKYAKEIHTDEELHKQRPPESSD